MGLLVPSEARTRKSQRAFTFIELLVVVAIIGIMSTVGYVSMSRLQMTADTRTSIDKLVASVKTQRMYAMLGNSTTRTKAMPQGIYFQQGSSTYVLFSCDELQSCSYLPYKNTNINDTLEKTLIFSNISLPGNQIIFAPFSGEVANFQTDANSVMIDNVYDHTVTTIRVTQVGTLEISP
jgi:prepilin-type N-terminal cleavage/methylation domain-containing protein